MTESAKSNIRIYSDDIPVLSTPVETGYRRVIVLIAKNENLMDKVWRLNTGNETRVHIFNFCRSLKHNRVFEDSKHKLKKKFGVLPNYSDYGDLESGDFHKSGVDKR